MIGFLLAAGTAITEPAAVRLPELVVYNCPDQAALIDFDQGKREACEKQVLMYQPDWFADLSQVARLRYRQTTYYEVKLKDGSLLLVIDENTN